MAYGRWMVSSPGHRLPGLQSPDPHPICSPPKTASSPGGDRKAPAAPTRAEKEGSPALTLCHQPAPWFSHRCRSQARPRKPGSQRHGPRGWGIGDTKAEIERKRGKEKETETGRKQANTHRKKGTQRHNQRRQRCGEKKTDQEEKRTTQGGKMRTDRRQVGERQW